MATSTLIERQQKYLLKKLHVLLGKAGIGEAGKREMLASFGVESAKELDAHELLELCGIIDGMLRPDAAEMDKWRKRLIAAIFAWRKAMAQTTTMNEVKAIACRAAQVDRFNAIPLERLRSLYYAFGKKTKDMDFVERLTKDDLDMAAWVN